jgi:hypothetical protein
MMIPKRALIIILTLVCMTGTVALSQSKLRLQEPRLLTFDDLKRIEDAYMMMRRIRY